MDNSSENIAIITEAVATTISGWKDISDTHRKIATKIMHNVISDTFQGIQTGYDNITSLIFIINMKLTRNLLCEFTKIVGVQPVNTQLDQIYKMESMPVELTTMDVDILTSRFHVDITGEAVMELEGYNRLDLEAELAEVVANKITGVVLEYILDNIILGYRNNVFATIEPSDFVVNKHPAFTFIINRALSNIGWKSRRSAGNFLIVPVQFVQYLPTHPTFVASNEEPDDSVSKLASCGLINGSIAVYSHSFLEDNIIVGYKNKTSEIDTGFVYSPLIPAFLGEMVPYPQLMGSYAMSLHNPNYYNIIKVNFPPQED